MSTKWLVAWRYLADYLQTAGIAALRDALASDDPRLIQGKTVWPSPLADCADGPPAAWCALGCVVAAALPNPTVREVLAGWRDLLSKASPHVARFVEGYDDEPRGAMRKALLAEVERTLAQRGALPCVAAR